MELKKKIYIISYLAIVAGLLIGYIHLCSTLTGSKMEAMSLLGCFIFLPLVILGVAGLSEALFMYKSGTPMYYGTDYLSMPRQVIFIKQITWSKSVIQDDGKLKVVFNTQLFIAKNN